MARCTAPVRGHRTASAAAACPACGSRYGGYRSSWSYPSPDPSSGRSASSSGSRSGAGGSGRGARPRWSPAGSSVVYTPAQVLTPIGVANDLHVIDLSPSGVDRRVTALKVVAVQFVEGPATGHRYDPALGCASAPAAS
ncbi:MAG: hypothetical protein ACI8PZ_007105 [Myxococcota bacterium]|jgi:hypothetical protein